MVKKMNLANKLTVLRVLLIPPFVVFLLLGGNGSYDNALPFGILYALIIFILASVTDWLDGYIARKYNMITDLGKFLDPLADKILVISALVCFVEIRWAPAWIVVVIVAREFIVTGFRLAVVTRDNKAVIAADIWGKIKTALTMLTIITGLLMHTLLRDFGLFAYLIALDTPQPFFFRYLYPFYDFLLYASVAMTVISGTTAIWKNRRLFSDDLRDKD